MALLTFSHRLNRATITFIDYSQCVCKRAWRQVCSQIFRNVCHFRIFRQHAASIYGFVRQFCFVCRKKIYATSKQGRRLRFGMLTVLTNIRSTKVLHHVSCIMHQASCIVHHSSCIMHCSQEAEIWYVDRSHKYKIIQGVMVGGRRPLVEDNL